MQPAMSLGIGGRLFLLVISFSFPTGENGAKP